MWIQIPSPPRFMQTERPAQSCWDLWGAGEVQRRSGVWQMESRTRLVGWSVMLEALWSSSRLSQSAWVQNATQAEWWQVAPSFHCTTVNVKMMKFRIQVLYFSRSSVWNCTQYVCSAFSKYLVLTPVIHGKCIQLNFRSAGALEELVVLLGWPWWQEHSALLHPNRPLFLLFFYSQFLGFLFLHTSLVC